MSPRALFRARNLRSIRICPAPFRKVTARPTALALSETNNKWPEARRYRRGVKPVAIVPASLHKEVPAQQSIIRYAHGLRVWSDVCATRVPRSSTSEPSALFVLHQQRL